MPELLIQLTKRADGSAVLRCVRADGSATWQRHRGRQQWFFPVHDLTHYAVESELGFQRGFYGLMADGWDIEDTGGKGARGPLPEEAVIVEQIVGCLAAERASGTEWPCMDFNQQAAVFAAAAGRPAPRALTDADLARVRARARELSAHWAALGPGATLQLSFDRLRESQGAR